MLRPKQYVQLMFAALFIVVVLTPMHAQSTYPDICMHSFERFAYEGPRDPEEPLKLPAYPWELVSIVLENAQNIDYYIEYVGLTRDDNNNSEIWLRASSLPELNRVWLIYSPQTQETRIISAKVPTTNYLVSSLLIGSSNTIWGLYHTKRPRKRVWK